MCSKTYSKLSSASRICTDRLKSTSTVCVMFCAKIKVMEISLYIIAIIIVVVAIIIKLRESPIRSPKNNQYNYQAKQYFMTRTESEFFLMLDKAVGYRYYIFPQAHLSAILNHKVPGQNWKNAFRHINGKSVDYVLCDKQTLKTVYAIELDDYTHQYRNRQQRDEEVERMLSSAGIQLIRISDYKSFDINSIT
jgi:energy-converting hydrogenase Eha subunit A